MSLPKSASFTSCSDYLFHDAVRAFFPHRILATLSSLIPLPAADPLAAVKRLVLDAVSSPHTQRSYDLALSRFLVWYFDAGSPGLHRATVQRYRSELEQQGLSPSSLNVHLSAVRKLA